MIHITNRFLEDYRDSEREKGEIISPDLLQPNFTIKNARGLYPEYVLKKPFGVHRPGVNIALLMFFYRQVVAYVPPITQDQFKFRFGIPYSAFLRLSYPGNDSDQFIFPVLNHPRRYKHPEIRNQLADLLVKMPPTWERWHSALDFTGGNIWFEKSDQNFNYSNIWSLPDFRSEWKSRLRTTSESFVSKEIKQQIRNNYTDLCLVGQENIANKIAKTSFDDPAFSINDLLYSSDLHAYPAVLGGGGVANIKSFRSPTLVPIKASSKLINKIPSIKNFDSDVLETLLGGLKFDKIPKEFHLEFLLAWHKSGNAERARTAYHALLKSAQLGDPSLEDLHKTMKVVIKELQEFCSNSEPERRKADKISQTKQTVISGISAVGGIACSITGLFLLDVIMTALGVGFTLVGVKQWSTKERVIQKLLKKHAPNVPFELFSEYIQMRDFSEDFFRKIKSMPTPLENGIIPGTASVPVRTLWWSE